MRVYVPEDGRGTVWYLPFGQIELIRTVPCNGASASAGFWWLFYRARIGRRNRVLVLRPDGDLLALSTRWGHQVAKSAGVVL